MKQDKFYSEITHWLMANFKPGDHIPGEIELSERFNVARATIREVIVHLSFLGVLERHSKRGTFMRAPDVNDISSTMELQLQIGGFGFEEMKQTRLFLETSQAELVIQRIRPQELEHLEHLISAMEKSESNVEAADQLDLEFHIELVSVTGNRILKIFSGIMLLMFDKKYRGAFLNKTAIRKSVKDHRKMLDAIRKQDASLLRKLIQEHIEPL